MKFEIYSMSSNPQNLLKPSVFLNADKVFQVFFTLYNKCTRSEAIDEVILGMYC